MYKHYLKIKPIPDIGLGVFAAIDVPAGVPICEFKGDFFRKEDLINPCHPATLQIDKNLFLGPSGEADDYFNHSCNPNAALHIVGNRAFLYSLYVIPAGSEITFDYSTSSTDTQNEWSMKCLCGSVNCRKIISGFQYLDDKTKKEYRRKGMVPSFMNKK